MPLHRARLRTRLHHHVLRRQWTTKLSGSVANGLISGEQRSCGGGFCSQAHRGLGEGIANGDVMAGETGELAEKVRSEERRVGEEGRFWGSPYHLKKKKKNKI